MSALQVLDLTLSVVLAVALVTLIVAHRRQRRTIVDTGAELMRTEERFRRLAESSPLGIFELDAEGHRVYANPRLLELTHGDADGEPDPYEVLPMPWHLPADDAAVRIAEWEEACAAHRPHSGRWRIQRDDDEYRWIRFDAAPLLADDELTGWIGSVADVTDEQSLAEQHARLSEIIETTPDVVAMLDAAGRYTYLNEAARYMWGLDDSIDVSTVSVTDCYAITSRDLLRRVALPTALRDGVWSGEVVLLDAKGEEIPVSQIIVAHRLDDGTVDYFSCISRDISERRAFEAQLVYQGLHDALTGLPNRVLFSDRLSHALSRANRHRGTIAVFLLDLDHFKLVNDSYGHDVGDELLLATAARVQEALRPGDTAARFGGDEFAILCEDLHDTGQAVEMAERLAGALAAPFDLEDADGGRGGPARIFLTASIGIALPVEPGPTTPESMLRDADAALNRAKDAGRARHVLFVEDFRQSAVHRLRTANDLHQALAEEEFRVVYQPEVSLTDGHVVAVEALVRWHHPERGLVPPAEFVPLAEETGIVVPIGAWVLDRAAQQAAIWTRRRDVTSPFTVWVNVSARQLAQNDLVDMVANTLARHQVSPYSIGLEITESALLDDTDLAISTLAALRALGVRLAVDDFGTGYSSLSYLKQLPVDQLKVDRSFVEGLETDGDASAIVAAVTGMARALRLTTVAEGVETSGQVEALRRLDCDVAQGYYFTTPQPPANITRLLEADLHAALFPPVDAPSHHVLRLAPVMAGSPVELGSGGVPAPRQNP